MMGIADEDSVVSDEGDGSDDGRQMKGKDEAGTSSKEAKLGRTGADQAVPDQLHGPQRRTRRNAR